MRQKTHRWARAPGLLLVALVMLIGPNADLRADDGPDLDPTVALYDALDVAPIQVQDNTFNVLHLSDQVVADQEVAPYQVFGKTIANSNLAMLRNDHTAAIMRDLNGVKVFERQLNFRVRYKSPSAG